MNYERITNNSQKGFTLIELMVAIAIIAILATVGISLFTNAQKGARDTQRRGEIDAIANALETNKVPGATYYSNLTATQFAGGAIPADPGGNGSSTYCAAVTGTVGAPPANPTAWTNATACPTATGTWTEVSSGGVPFDTADSVASWTICALLENGTTLAQKLYCKQSAQ